MQLCAKNPTRTLRQTPSYGGGMVVEKDMTRLYKLKLNENNVQQTYELIEALQQLEDVEFAEPNYIVSALGEPAAMPLPQPNPQEGGYFNPTAYAAEPMYSQQWGLPAVNLPQLWAADTASSTDRPIIAIIDTGVDTEHPDLEDNIWTNSGESDEPNGYDNDNNGFVDDRHGWDFVNQTPNVNDFNSHGTHCAGIAAAVGDNGIGICGANPNALIMPIAVLQSNGTGDIATIIQGINYAANNGADVISMSFGGYAHSIAFEQALAQAYQSAVLVAAAGNDGRAIDERCCPGCIPTPMPMYPGAYTFVLGVQATHQLGGWVWWTNWDCDGPVFSQYREEQLYNYELSAPGVGIISTVPNGQYRYYNGTSMSTPLVAGGISALMHAKHYVSFESLWGDLINTSNGQIDFFAAYNSTNNAPAKLWTIAVEINDTISGDGDFRADVGETIEIYPTLKNTWGFTDSITIWLEFHGPEDTTTLEILTENVPFGYPLYSYASSKSLNPIRAIVNNNIVDGRIINLDLCATSPTMVDTMRHNFTIMAENCTELHGFTNGNMILTPNYHYVVDQYLAVPEGDTLFVMPGTTIKFRDNARISVSGYMKAFGTPDSIITLTKTDLGQSWGGFYGNIDMKYCKISNIYGNGMQYYNGTFKSMEHCQLINNINCSFSVSNYDLCYTDIIPSDYYVKYSNFINNSALVESRGWCRSGYIGSGYNDTFNNHINNYTTTFNCSLNTWNNETNSQLCNIFHNWHDSHIGYWSYSFIDHHQLPEIVNYFQDSLYLGSGVESIFRQSIYDALTPGTTVFGLFDVSKVMNHPVHEAHGIVWKVVVNGYDAQDEFEQLPPLGIGRHEFKVYFNRAMNTAVAPMVAMGVRPPYTQNAIATDGSWSEDSTIYTVYLDLTPEMVTDGLNRIYVANAEDDDYFEIPYENRRFNVQVSAAGSLSAGFMATAGLGKIDLEWNNNDVNFDDFLGYNMYRYRIDTTYNTHYGYDEQGNYGIITDTIVGPVDSVMLNTSLIQDTMFTDFEVEPGQRYYYYYKVLRTNLSENDPSKVVSSVPLSSIRGDANGSFVVDVADVVTTVSFITSQNPQPFIFGAADVNEDGVVDVLDIVGIINIIMNPDYVPARGPAATAIYTVEEGILYVETPVELGGVQVMLNMSAGNSIVPLDAMSGFEKVSAWMSDEQYLFMAYSMSGKRLGVGKHALLRLGNAEISNIALSDPMGVNVLAIEGNTVGITLDDEIQMVMEQPYPNPFKNSISIPYTIGVERANQVEFVITDIMGRQIDRCYLGTQTRGKQIYTWTPRTTLKSGIYFVVMRCNGINIQRAKMVCVE